MKIAHLILAHANPSQIKRLVQHLKYNGAHIYIHIDAKIEITPFVQEMKSFDQVFFIKNRTKIKWGGYTMIDATIQSFREILDSGNQYDYIQLMSGQDYPIRPLSEFHKFLEHNPGKAFMHYLSVFGEWHEAITRVTEYHLVNFDFPGKYTVEKIINKILPDRKMPLNYTPVGRSQWFTASSDCIKYLVTYLEKSGAIRRFFKLSWAPDEMIFQTILYNSPLKDKMVNDNLLYLDWSAGQPNPKVLTIDDKDAILNSGKFFGRKFVAAKDEKILDFLDQQIAAI